MENKLGKNITVVCLEETTLENSVSTYYNTLFELKKTGMGNPWAFEEKWERTGCHLGSNS